MLTLSLSNNTCSSGWRLVIGGHRIPELIDSGKGDVDWEERSEPIWSPVPVLRTAGLKKSPAFAVYSSWDSCFHLQVGFYKIPEPSHS